MFHLTKFIILLGFCLINFGASGDDAPGNTKIDLTVPHTNQQVEHSSDDSAAKMNDNPYLKEYDKYQSAYNDQEWVYDGNNVELRSRIETEDNCIARAVRRQVQQRYGSDQNGYAEYRHSDLVPQTP